MLDIHQNIKEKLKYFHSIHKIPNIIFNGPSGSGKSTLLNEFLTLIYDGDKDKMKEYIMYGNCAHEKGIKFIRDEIKFFAKTHIYSNSGDTFKSIVLYNSDKLTIDAQSALRRCIESFSHNSRFFIVVEDKYKLLKPILSRFCEIYVPEPVVKGVPINLYRYNLQHTFKLKDVKVSRNDWLKKELQKMFPVKTATATATATSTTTATATATNDEVDATSLHQLVTKLYEKSYNALDLMKLLQEGAFSLTQEKQYELLVAFHKTKKEFRNEKLMMMFILQFVFLDKERCLDNLTFI